MRVTTALSKVAVLLGLLLLGLGSANAQKPTQAQTNAIKQSCRSDYQSYCSNVPTGGSAALQCLQGHVADLSAPCQAAVNAIGQGGSAPPSGQPMQSMQAPAAAAPVPQISKRQEVALMRRSCGGDFRAYCRGVELGGGRALSCLAANQQRLSPPCRSALAEARGER